MSARILDIRQRGDDAIQVSILDGADRPLATMQIALPEFTVAVAGLLPDLLKLEDSLAAPVFSPGFSRSPHSSSLTTKNAENTEPDSLRSLRSLR